MNKDILNPNLGDNPFLKWAGGKRWFMNNYSKLLPGFTGHYYEVFLGGGAVFFSLNPISATLNDINSDLVDTYLAIRDDHEAVESLLNVYQEEHSKDFYYAIRKINPTTRIDRAARFIYLNRTCWNGLYRVNLDGHFNVPIGTKTEVSFPPGTLSSISARLRGMTLTCSDFELIIDQSQAGDLVFADPPYTVNHNFNGFLKYNERLFAWEDQRRLHAATLRAAHRGVNVVVTNADHACIRELYSEAVFSRQKVKRHSKLSGSADGRKAITELVIRTDLADPT